MTNDGLYATLVALTGRRLTMSEVYDAVGLSRQQYSAARQEGKLITPNRMILAAERLGINPVELLTECGILAPRDAAEYVDHRREEVAEHIVGYGGAVANDMQPSEPGETLTARNYHDLVNTVAMLRLLGHEDIAEQVWQVARAHRPDDTKRRLNDRKRAWQLVHQEIRRRALDQDPDDTFNQQSGMVMREVENDATVIIELAGFAATFALMQREPDAAIALADAVGAGVMREPDEVDEDDDEAVEGQHER